jgi:hypothetical protein
MRGTFRSTNCSESVSAEYDRILDRILNATINMPTIVLGEKFETKDRHGLALQNSLMLWDGVTLLTSLMEFAFMIPSGN